MTRDRHTARGGCDGWKRAWVLVVLGLALGNLMGCARGTASPTPPLPTWTPGTPFRPLSPTPVLWPTATPSPTPTATPTATPEPPAFWVPPGVPWSLEGWRRADDPTQALVRLVLNPEVPQGFRVFVPAVPAFTWAPQTPAQAVLDHWQGRASPLGNAALLMTPETRGWLEAAWGPPATGRVQVVPQDQLLERALAQPPGWTLLPWEALTPDWRVVLPWEQRPFRRDYDPTQDPLALPLAWEGPPGLVAAWQERFPLDNRDPNAMTVVVLTGVTALVRATAFTMEMRGITYPAEDVGPLLASADITHISNEVPFDPDCPPPNPVQQSLRFCSDPRYLELLRAVGTDVVELTGDHFNDRGPEAMYYTLELYREQGWAYYGGGANLEEARKPLLLEHNGNRLAFLGCNAKGGGYATAREDYPGTWACDWDVLAGLIRQVREQGYLPIVTYQHQEIYAYDPPESFKYGFRRAAEAGAVVVSGSQAHHPHGMERYREAFIQYGLGNLFFDQKGVVLNGDKGFLAFHVFYRNRLLTMYPVPILLVDFAKPRVVPWNEARAWMEPILQVSRWNAGP